MQQAEAQQSVACCATKPAAYADQIAIGMDAGSKRESAGASLLSASGSSSSTQQSISTESNKSASVETSEKSPSAPAVALSTAFSPLDWLLVLGVALTWGSAFLFIKVALPAFEPAAISLIRMAIGPVAVLLALVALCGPASAFAQLRHAFARAVLPRTFFLGVVWMAIPLSLVAVAETRIDSSLTGMVIGSVPIWGLFIASVVERRPPRRSQCAGLALGFVGVVLTILPTMHADRDGVGGAGQQAVGVAVALLAAVCLAAGGYAAAPLQQSACPRAPRGGRWASCRTSF